MFENLFKLRGALTSQQKIVLGIIGLVIFLALWALVAELVSEQTVRKIIPTNGEELVIQDRKYYENDSLRGEHLDLINSFNNEELAQYGLERVKVYNKLSRPLNIIKAFPVLINKYNLFENTGKSLWINLAAYFFAIIIALPIGFALGLIPLIRGLFGKILDAFRFIPLAAVTYIFVAWFGFYNDMKIAFLAFGIIVYLIPVIVQRIDEVKDVYLKTVFTLGASTWDTIRDVYIPSVISRISDDIRVLTAISWTYVTVAEMANNTGGLGGMIYSLRRQSNTDYAFVILIVIILIGILQDYILKLLDRILFKYKYTERGGR